jgi:hypothetical protein
VSDPAPQRRRLTSVLGYSSACVPSILAGSWPAQHRNWSYFVYDPAHSPFKSLRPLRWLPRALTSRRRVRRWLSKFVKARLNFKGYFDLYNIPFRDIGLFDFTEKKNPLKPRGMNRGPNIFDFLVDRRIPYHVSNPQLGEPANLDALLRDITAERIDFAFLYWPDLDALLHRVGNRSPLIPQKLRGYEKAIHHLMAVTSRHYAEVRLYVFSDHGMANCEQLLDLRALINELPCRAPRDYAAVYDSTMARFWFFNPEARRLITRALDQVQLGRVLPDDELEQLGVLFPDRYFGELIFLVQEGVLIVPSDMGQRPLAAMHGYHPAEKHSFAALCSNHADVPDDILAIPDVFKLMTRDAELAALRNKGAPVPAAVCH